MCGRYYVDPNIQDAAVTTGEVRPTDMAMVITSDGPRAMRWGFKNPAGNGVVINARAETAMEKPMFSASLRARRIAVPTNGFYEWKRVGKKTAEQGLFTLSAEKTVYLAGFYAPFAEGDSVEERFVILTTPANESVSHYHDRMPLYLKEEEIDAWIRRERPIESFLFREQPMWEASVEGGQLSLF